MSNNARSPLLIGGLGCAGVAVLLFAIDDAHSAFSKDGCITVTFPDCPFPRGCRVVLNLADVPPGDAGAQIVLSYPERDSEYLDEIELEYSADS